MIVTSFTLPTTVYENYSYSISSQTLDVVFFIFRYSDRCYGPCIFYKNMNIFFEYIYEYIFTVEYLYNIEEYRLLDLAPAIREEK